jgi:hypothetical protein
MRMAKQTESEAAKAERVPRELLQPLDECWRHTQRVSSWPARSVRWGRRTSSKCSRRLRPARRRLCARGSPDRFHPLDGARFVRDAVH